LKQKLKKILARLGTVLKQKKTYECIDEHLSSRSNEAGDKLKMVVMGPGGAGKTEIIKAIVLRSKIRYGRTCGKYGPAIVVGPSGSSAANAGAI